MADEAATKIGAILEQLSARFELVVEVISGFDGRLQELREDMFGQFSEVGKQVRFLCEQIVANRDGLEVTRSDLSAEMVRLGEALGAARVEFRETLTSTDRGLRGEIGEVRAEMQRAAARTAEPPPGGQEQLRSEIAGSSEAIRGEIARSAESAARQLRAELKHTNKALATLTHKFDRFDDRLSIQVKDHDQRLKKIERRARS